MVMKMIKTKWILADPTPNEVDHSLNAFPKVFRQVLYNRGIKNSQEAVSFLEGDTAGDTDPFLLKDMDRAVERILRAIQHRENIVVYGDYDVDGITSTALLTSFLSRIGGKVTPYIPEREKEGYGLNFKSLSHLISQNFDLLITVDCGIRSHAEVADAQQSHLDVIITDHHHPGELIPDAIAVINPKQPGDKYPEKNLAGVGLAYKLATAVHDRLSSNQKIDNDPKDDLDLVALGTVADVAPLTAENRTLVKKGLNRLQFTRKQGLRSLIGAAGILNKEIKAEHIGFILGPRLNAAGRMGSANDALKLLLTDDVQTAGKLAQELNNLNRQRQEKTIDELSLARNLITYKQKPSILIACSSEFSDGILGLVAASLSRELYRPCIIAKVEDEVTKASCRSIPEFHITQALDECQDLLLKHGGHRLAAGFTVRNENKEIFFEKIKQIAERYLSGKELQQEVFIDAEASFKDLDHTLLKNLDGLQPTGHMNPNATFLSKDLDIKYQRKIGRGEKHLKMKIEQNGIVIDAIAFGFGEMSGELQDRVDLVYNFELNEYNGIKSFQLNVRDLKPAS
jgi:single-stranded-DNA-specific exonuclease